MKKLLITIAVLGAMTEAAHAQGSVTLYGIIDEGINYTSNAGGHSLYNLSSGMLQGSRFGLRGEENLGGGLKAVFTLENGFDVNSGKLGQGGLMFGRQAFVGLASERFGRVTLGRQYDSVVDYVGILSVADAWGGTIAAHAGDIDNFNNSYRTNNTVKYVGPRYGGFTWGGTYSVGGVAGSVSQNQIWSLGAGYAGGSVTLGIGYLNARTPSNLGGLFGNSTSAATPAVVSNPIYSGYASANSYQVIALGGTYAIGAATLGATYSNVRFLNLGGNGATGFRAGGSATFDNAELSLRYQLTPALLLASGFDYTRSNAVTLANGASNAGARYYQGEIGADYALSKRTDVYFSAVYQKASGHDSTGKDAVAALTSLSASSTDHQAAVHLAIRQKF
ncbi:porin [Burkholderia sp. 3C]